MQESKPLVCLNRGYWIVFEGPKYTGKTTALAMLGSHTREQLGPPSQHDRVSGLWVQSEEPTRLPSGVQARNAAARGDDDMHVLKLMTEDRKVNMRWVVAQNQKGVHVYQSRTYISTAVFQGVLAPGQILTGGRVLDTQIDTFGYPDLVIFMDPSGDAHEAAQVLGIRAIVRGDATHPQSQRLAAQIEAYRKVVAIYESRSMAARGKKGVLRVDALMTPPEILRCVWDEVGRMVLN